MPIRADCFSVAAFLAFSKHHMIEKTNIDNNIEPYTIING